MSQPLLDVRNLHTHLHPGNTVVKAVDDVSFSIPRGETFCLVGESGSGKSISALSVIRLLPHGLASHPKGEILFNGQDLLRMPEADLRNIRGSQIAMIFQEPMTSLNPVFTVGEQIVEALQLHHPDMNDAEAEERAILALEQVQLPKVRERFHDYPHQLSGGQRQRVMIAMALACEPELLIADEPTTALDVTVQAEILRLMRKLQDDTGMSTLFITHDFGVVAQMAQQVGVMQRGKLVEVGRTAQVLRNPQHAYTQQLLAAVPENLGKAGSSPHPNSPQQGLGKGEAILQIRDLNVWFPIKKGIFRHTVDHVRAVDGVSLDIPKGQIVALVGESGCGKTTLGRAVLQLEKPTSGSIRLQGQELTGLSARELRPLRPKMQIVFQDPQSSLNPRLLIETTLTEPMQVHGIGSGHEERIELASRVLDDLQLPRDTLWRYPHEFSGGQRQRIGLARALVLNPEFIVCDEITSALDVSVQAEILQLLLKIRAERHLTLLFITHNIGVVEYLSDQTVVMYKGKVVEQGATAQVCGSPQDAYTQKLLAAVPRLMV
ncbi:MAG TPA: dipeptide ABC transporter ATP-binding protein [Candidatus Thiothrix moscowensis]|uniref:ABC transporter ATP-binding protein n=2 Tax=Thiothrix TaxID=1030 RepID=UPI0025F548A2|nr:MULTISPECIES: dipeptide ABC transporter ATP-binding protein [unclassified Thiothrix]HRJ53178.1 dipeptide ABC transporter ATP-binding protein [Candidatus Thiothrix moscowensis]HRJ93252.1 dipeptide ABC transporter ATP-binding protein [Candidatus Thiothrix moscowensis]